MAKAKCTVKFVRTKRGLVGQLWYRGERLNEESVDPGERDLVKYTLLKQCKERVAARNKPGFSPGRFFRMLDDMRNRSTRR